MKTFTAMIALIFSVSVMAQDFNFVQGGFGTDGASLEPMPTKQSAIQAAELYKAMKVKDIGGKKFIGVVIDGDNFGLTCKKPSKGIHTTTAGCEFTALATKEDSEEGIRIETDVTVRMTLASALISKIKMKKSARVGATTYEVANLKCTSGITGRGVIQKCTFSDVNTISMDLDQMVKEGALTKAQAKILIQTAGF